MFIYKVWNSIRNLKKYKLQELVDDAVNSSKKIKRCLIITFSIY